MIIIHRHTFTTREAVDALVPDIGDCEGVRITFEGGLVAVDIIGPGQPPMEPPPPPSNEAAKISTATEAEKPQEPDRPKGGPLARRAAILCAEGGFQAFLEVKGADGAAAEICRLCGIDSRAWLDHDARAAAIWHDIETKYRLWLDGY